MVFAALLVLLGFYYLYPYLIAMDQHDEQIHANDQAEIHQAHQAPSPADWSSVLNDRAEIDLRHVSQGDLDKMLDDHVDDHEILRLAAALGEATTDVVTARRTVTRYLRVFERVGGFAIRIAAVT